jgi:hypothetical protein
MTSEVLYLVFVPGFTILAFLIGSGAAMIAMSAKQDPTSDEPEAEGHTEAAH